MNVGMLIENEQNTHIAANKWISRVAYLQACLLACSNLVGLGLDRQKLERTGTRRDMTPWAKRSEYVSQ